MKTLKKYRWPLTGALLGALIFLLLYGVRVLDPTSVDWILNNPSPDPAQHYLGWELFRRSPVHLPYIGANYNAVYPFRTSVLFTDSLPLAALLYDTLGVGRLLLIQGALSVLAALIENSIHVQESRRDQEPLLSLKTWWRDIREAAAYLRQEHGLHGLYEYMAVTNGMAMGYAPLLIAFFRTAQGFTTAMYSFFSVAEFAGRTIGGAVRYRTSLPERKRFGFLFGVYQTYELMDACLLWLPYPLMLVNRALCGFLGIQSATIRQAAVQRHIPDRLRARLNAYESVLCTAAGAILSLAIGALGEVLDYRLCMTVCGLVTMTVCWLTVFLRRHQVQQVLAARPHAAQSGEAQ